MTHATLNDLLTSWNIDSQQLQQQHNTFETLTTQSIKKNDIFQMGVTAAIFCPLATLTVYAAFSHGKSPNPLFVDVILMVLLSSVISLFAAIMVICPILKLFVDPYGTKDGNDAKYFKTQNRKTIKAHRSTFNNLYEQYRANLALIRTTYAKNPTKHPNLLTMLNEYHDREPTLDILLSSNVDAILHRLDSQPQFIQLQSFVDSHSEIFDRSV